MKLFGKLGKNILNGGVSIFNIEEYLKRAESGDTEAMIAVAKYYEDKDVCYDDEKDSMYWYERAAKNGNIEAQMYLGNSCNGNIIDLPDAIYWYKKAAEQGSTEAYSRLSALNYRWSYRYNENYRLYKYFDLLECYKSAVQGNMEAQYDLATRYEYGNEVEYDLEKALFWYKESGRNSNIEAWIRAIDIYKKMDNDLYAYAEEIEACYYEMLNCPDIEYFIDEVIEIREFISEYYECVGEDEAAESYRDIANFETDKSNSIKIRNTNINYEKKKYEEIMLVCRKMNEEELPKIYWRLKKLAEQGFAEAQYYLGNAEEIKGNKKHAFFWYSRAAEQANVRALKKIAFFYEHGIAMKKNLEEAEYYNKLAS